MHIAGALVVALLAGGGLSAGLPFSSGFPAGNTFHIPLTDRQKAILRDQGLPEIYEELTPSQKSMILLIEELLENVEDKYGKEMLYENWQPETPDEPGVVSLEFRDPDWSGEVPNATVIRREAGGTVIISDDYESISAEILRQEPMQNPGRALTETAG